MRTHRWGTIALLLLSASAAVTTAYAQDAPDLAPCRQILDTLPAVQPKSAITVTRPDPQTCRFAPISFSGGRLIAWAMDSLTVTGLHPSGLEPVRIEAVGIRSVPAIPNPVAAYLNKVAAIPFNIAVTYVSDPQARLFTLQQFSMRGETVGTIEVRAALTNIVLQSDPLSFAPPALPDPATISLASLSIRLDNHGFVERMLTPVVAGFVASSAPQADLEPLIEAQKKQVAGFITAMPALYGLEPPTAQALARFVMDFPHPTGSMQCSLAPDPPLHLPTDGNPSDDDAIRAIVAAAHLTCSYAPA